MNISESLKHARISRGLKRREIAALLDLSEVNVYRWEEGLMTPRGGVIQRYIDAGLLTITINNNGPLPATNPKRPATQTA